MQINLECYNKVQYRRIYNFPNFSDLVKLILFKIVHTVFTLLPVFVFIMMRSIFYLPTINMC